MVWTTPKTWNVGDVMASPDLNTYVRDNTATLRLPTTYRAEMYVAGAWTAGTGDTLVPFDTIVYDPNGSCVTGAAAKYTTPVAGLYTVDGAFQATPNSLTIVRLFRNGLVVRQCGINPGNVQSGNITSFCFSYLCAAADVLQINVRASAAGSVMSTGPIVAYSAFRLTSGS